MTGFEMAIIILGVLFLLAALQGVQMVGKTLTNHYERQSAKLDRIHVELMSMNDRLADLVRNMDKS